MSLLRIEKLRVHYAQGAVPALDGVDLELKAGERLGVVGPSGCGKSTLAAAILGLLPHSAQVSGRLMFQGRNLLPMPERELRHVRGQQIAAVFQDPGASLTPHLRIRTLLCEHVPGPKSQRLERAKQTLAAVGLPDAAAALERFPHQFSGGQRQRIAIAQALMTRPQLILADEPTTALDAHLRSGILQLLIQQSQDQGAALVLISHDLSLVRGLCQQVLVMDQGRVVEQGTPEQLFAQPQADLTKQLLAAVLEVPRRAPERGNA